jgi:branched-subunit amino acid aminotransferase/4-amino-4-deoxychorismate lyase
VHEAQLTAYDLYAADEVFLTSTAGGIMPLARSTAGRSATASRPHIRAHP